MSDHWHRIMIRKSSSRHYCQRYHRRYGAMNVMCPNVVVSTMGQSIRGVLLLSLFILLLSCSNGVINYHHHHHHHHHNSNNNQVLAFRSISISTSSALSLSSHSSSTLVPSNATKRQHHPFKKNAVLGSHTKRRTVLWQQQQQQQETGIKKEKATVTTTASKTTSATSSSDETKVIGSSKSGSNKFVVVLSALGLLTTCMIAAITGILPGYYDMDNNKHILLISTLGRDVGSTILTGILGYTFVQCVTYLTVTKQYLVSRDARKIIHTLSAPLFILFWPLFATTTSPSSRIFAAIVPILNGIRLYIASKSTANDNNNNNADGDSSSSESALAQAVSRSGDSSEALGGPFIYVCMLATCILCFWTDTPHGIIAMSTLAAGDGMADIIGRRYGSTNPWPYNSRKSIIGSLAFVVASSITSLTLIWWIQYTGSGLFTLSSQYTTIDIAINIIIISSIAAIVETIPWLGDDNYTVPISAAIVSMLLFS